MNVRTCARIEILGALAFLAASLALLHPAHAQSSGSQSSGGQKAPTPVIAVEVATDIFVDRIEALGTTRGNESVRITANVTEKVVGIAFEDGQQVSAGDVLVTLEKAEEVAELGASEALLAERQLAYRRTEQLAARQAAAEAQLEERRAAVRQMEAEIEAIHSRIADREIRAPFAGVVGLRNISLGTLVTPGDLITTLDDLSVVKVDFNVPSTYLATLKPGLAIAGRVPAFGDRTFEGEVRSIDSRVDPVTRSVVVRAVLPNDNGLLRPGLLMTIELLKDPREVVVIPEEALVPRGRATFVMLVDRAVGDKVVEREVKIGARRPGEVEIREGLTAGEIVITHGTLLVRPGQTVSVTIEAPDTPEAVPSAAVPPDQG